MRPMRTHAQIVREVGASALRRRLEDLGVAIQKTTTQRWADRNSIPGEYWAAVKDAGAATLDELATSADVRLRGDPAFCRRDEFPGGAGAPA